jgi:cytochrome d ubiquinol oxidase subunit I
MDDSSVQVSRILFGFAVAYHYIFVPLTIGLIGIITIIEGMAWITKENAWIDAGKFWRRFFILNFIFGILTGFPLRELLRTHWAQYSYQVEEVFNLIFGMEARLAPWLYGFVILLSFSKNMPAAIRFAVSAFLTLAVIAQSSGILALNAWMQYPVGVKVEAETGRFLLVDPWQLFANPLLLPKIGHTIGAAYVLGGMFVMALSAVCLLRAHHEVMARASFRVAAVVTLLSLGVTGYAGHASGELIANLQPAKFAAIEALWENEPAPEALTLFAIPDATERTNRHAIRVPHVLGWLAGLEGERSIKSLAQVKRETESAIRSAISPARPSAKGLVSIERYQRDVGVLSLLEASPKTASGEDISAAARRAIPPVPPLFWGFRVMVAVWGLLTVLVVQVAWRTPDAGSLNGRRLLWACVAALPLPWLATEAGWLVCEMGRQPWTVTGALATAQSNGTVGAPQGAMALLGLGTVYAVMLFANISLSLRWLRLGPATPVPFQWVSRRFKRLAIQPSREGGG